MLDIGRECCGCEACRSICPRHCISMKKDNEGFLYPVRKTEDCINCNLCEKVCPVLYPVNNAKEKFVFAAFNINETVRLQSSSGGLFTLIAEKIIERGGVVFGACFDGNWNVVHDYTDTIEGLTKFRGAKYVQSYIGNSFIKVKNFIESGREVLFTGTPCQVAGLKKFLKKPYSNLFTIDLVCHGVPSPWVWKKYLHEVVCQAFGLNRKEHFNVGEYISNINFRSKEKGWKKYCVRIEYKDGKVESLPFYRNFYMNFFLSDLSLRPSCYSCPAKFHNAQSDITLADFWGINEINPVFDDDKGCGLVLLNNKEKLDLLNRLNCKLSLQSMDDAVKYNPNIMNSVKKPVNRKIFFYFVDKLDFARLHNLLYNKIFIMRFIRFCIRKLLLKKFCSYCIL